MTDSIHKTLASGRWKEFSFAKQMANIGSEVSRAVKWKCKGNKEYMENAVERCLELIDLTVLSRQEHMKISGERKSCALTELMRVREVICDYFFCDNEYNSDDRSLIKYFDQFAIEEIIRNNRNKS